ncbi:hypothetical protein MSIMFB_03111 [Mycobacterium simulans]|uniref:Uncharacterized protein n=1 Tax=Mycobacterium simulans TaxID=627089 RepID=A0A7Z7IMZ5_9MYCO|nr:hypothetical protein MSIMFB_03111 [Mycobacterium simulans]
MKPIAPVRDDAVNRRWTAYWSEVGNERLLAIGTLLDLSEGCALIPPHRGVSPPPSRGNEHGEIEVDD